jgi:hypothetical protein
LSLWEGDVLTDEKVKELRAMFQELERVCETEDKRFWTEDVIVYENLELAPLHSRENAPEKYFVTTRMRLTRMLEHWPEPWSRIQ